MIANCERVVFPFLYKCSAYFLWISYWALDFMLSVTPLDQHCTLIIFSMFKDKTKRKADFSLLFATVTSCHYLHQFKIAGFCFRENIISVLQRSVKSHCKTIIFFKEIQCFSCDIKSKNQ